MAHKDREARNAYSREYKAKRRANDAYKEAERARERERYASRKDETHKQRLAKNARFRAANREQLAAAERERRLRLKEIDPEGFAAAAREKSRAWRATHADDEAYKAAARDRAKRAYQRAKVCPEFRERNQRKVRAWCEQNHDRHLASARERRAKRYKSDIQFKLGLCLRRRLYMAVRNNHRSGMAVRELGCSIAELRQHLERQFKPGMTWENWGLGGWHIDHIRPLASYDLSDTEQVRAACHYTNLQPLWAGDNIRKGGQFVE